jgi:hypothetical protein
MKFVDDLRVPADPYPELHEVLAAFVTEDAAVLADNLVGVYLVGSLAAGDFDLDSDIDFLVVTEADLTPAQVYALPAVQAQIQRMGCYPARHLEGSYIPQKLLADAGAVGQVDLAYFDNGSTRLERAVHDNQWHVRWLLRERGVTLVGPRPATLLPPIPPAEMAGEMKTTMLAVLRNFEADMEGPLSFFNSRFGQPFAVLTCCRILHTLQTGTVQSKKAGMEWARQGIAPAWVRLIDQAWQERQGVRYGIKIGQPADPARLKETLEFMQYAVSIMDAGLLE